MTAPLSYGVLCQENETLYDTGGVSQARQGAEFRSAFHDTLKQTADIAHLHAGSPAACHRLDGVPEDWVLQRDRFGRVLTVRSMIISGFMRNGRFYTHEQAMQICNHGSQLLRDPRRSSPCDGTGRISGSDVQDAAHSPEHGHTQDT